MCPACIFGPNQKRIQLTRLRACRLLAGGTLWDHLKRHRRMAERDVRVVARRLLEALAAMADIGVAHMDVKPCNIGLPRPWDLKNATLFDMGSWRRIGETLLVGARACSHCLPCLK